MTALLAMAFAAGLLAPINPCAFALLPAYLAYQATTSDSRRGRLVTGLSGAFAVSAGFVGVKLLLGLALAIGLSALLGLAPWFGVTVGILLAAAGLWMVAGRTLPMPHLPVPATRTTPADSTGGSGRLVAFGAVYAIGSLGCGGPLVVAAIIAQGLTVGSILGVLAAFVGFSLGAVIIFILVSVTAALAGGTLTARVSRLLPAIPRIAGGILILAGGYLIAYWAPVAVTGRTDASPVATVFTAVVNAVTAWTTTHQTLLALAAVGVVAATVITTLIRRARHPAPRTDRPDEKADIPS